MARVLVLGSYAPSLLNFRGPLLDAMVREGHVVVASAPEPDDQIESGLLDIGVTYRPVACARAGLSPRQDLAYILGLRRLIRDVEPDVVFAYTHKPVVYGGLAARLAGVKKFFPLITGLGYAFTGESSGKRGMVQKLVRGLYRLVLPNAQTVFFQNSDDAALFMEQGLVASKERFHVVNGSGVDLNRFAAQELPPQPVHFLLIARLLADKGIREYVEASRAVKLKYPAVTFHLVGGLDPNPAGIPAAEVEAWADEKVVVVHGESDDVRQALADCHVYVLPSYREGLPRTVLEAMATGRAIITTDVPGCRETVEHQVNGLLVDARNAEQLAAAMERFLEEPGLIETMGAESLRVVRTKFDVELVNADLLERMELRKV